MCSGNAFLLLAEDEFHDLGWIIDPVDLPNDLAVIVEGQDDCERHLFFISIEIPLIIEGREVATPKSSPIGGDQFLHYQGPGVIWMLGEGRIWPIVEGFEALPVVELVTQDGVLKRHVGIIAVQKTRPVISCGVVIKECCCLLMSLRLHGEEEFTGGSDDQKDNGEQGGGFHIKEDWLLKLTKIQPTCRRIVSR